MRRYASVFMLLARSVTGRLLAVFGGTAVLHGAALFLLRGQRCVEDIYDHWGMRLVFGAGLVLTTLLLINTLTDSDGKQDYILRRLRVSRQELFLCQAVFDVACFLLFWAVEVFIAMALCRLWFDSHAVTSHQAMYLTFYRSDLLHSLLPLDDVTRWIRNLLGFVSLGVCSAAAPILQRRGEQHLWVLVIPVIYAFAFPDGIAQISMDAVAGCLAVVLGFVLVVRAWGEEFRNED